MHLTPTEQRIMDLLADGLRHTRQEIHTCLDDDLSPLSAIYYHMTNLRKKLNPIGEDVICERRYDMPISYRRVRLLHSPNDGRR